MRWDKHKKVCAKKNARNGEFNNWRGQFIKNSIVILRNEVQHSVAETIIQYIFKWRAMFGLAFYSIADIVFGSKGLPSVTSCDQYVEDSHRTPKESVLSHSLVISVLDTKKTN